MSFVLPKGVTCTAKPVLNGYEQTLFNVCEDYFSIRQSEDNRCNVLSQVRLCDAINVYKPAVFSLKMSKKAYINNVQFNSLSFDVVITDSDANVLVIFEADGHTHRTSPKQQNCDAVKDAIVTAARLKLIRLEVDAVLDDIVVVRMKARFSDFSRDRSYQTPRGAVIFSESIYPSKQRTISNEDLELYLIRAGWKFPIGWNYAIKGL